jgi:glycosyltransferase involved in cell wall biosynthesis
MLSQLPPPKAHIAIVHYTASPVVGGVETVIEEHTRLLAAAGYPITLITGRGGNQAWPPAVSVQVIPEIDSEHPENQAVAAALEGGAVPPAFTALSDRIETALGHLLQESDIVMVHNAMTMHLNLPLTAALHRLTEQATIEHVIAWCHDVSRHVNALRGPVRSGFPWDLLRTALPGVTYVAVSQARRRLLAGVLGCARERIAVIPNGVDAVTLLGLSPLGQHLVETFGLLEADLMLLMPIRITHAKNIEFGLRVAQAIKTAGLRPRLVVTGPPDPHVPGIESYFETLRALRHELRLDDEVVFLYEGTTLYPGPLTLGPTTVAELYRVSDVVLMPSHREGFGMPVLEAGLADKPIFATPMPVVEELGHQLVRSIKPHDSALRVATRILSWAKHDAAHGLRRQVRQTYPWPAIFRRHIEPLILESIRASTG